SGRESGRTPSGASVGPSAGRSAGFLRAVSMACLESSGMSDERIASGLAADHRRGVDRRRRPAVAADVVVGRVRARAEPELAGDDLAPHLLLGAAQQQLLLL